MSKKSESPRRPAAQQKGLPTRNDSLEAYADELMQLLEQDKARDKHSPSGGNGGKPH